MTEYAAYIEKLALKNSDEIFYNSSEDHALIVLKNIVKKSKKYIKTICGNLCSEMSNDEEYLTLLDGYLSGDKSRTLQVLFDNNYNDGFKQKPIYELLSKYPNQVTVRKLNNGYVTYDDKPVHLTVSDDQFFRLETDIGEKMAWGRFKDSENSKVFRDAFDRFFTDEDSTEIPLCG